MVCVAEAELAAVSGTSAVDKRTDPLACPAGVSL